MHTNSKLLASFLVILAFAMSALAQASADVGIKANFAGGEVTGITDGKIALKTIDGPIDVLLVPATAYKRIPPDNPTLKAAIESSLSEIGVGDKLLVTGMVATDRKSIPAKAVYLITKVSISEKLSKEDQDWRSRGTNGSVVSIDPMTNAITVAVRGGMMSPARNVIVKPGANTEFMRYAIDSIEFSKAVKSKISDIEKGDEIRVLGDKNADGSEIIAEKVVSGGFKTTSGTVKSIDLAKGEVTISDVATKKDVTVSILQTSILKQFPPEMAANLARIQMMSAAGQGGFRPPTQGGQTTPGSQTTPQPTPNGQSNPQANTQQRTPGQFPGGGGQGGGMGGGMRGGFDDSRLPSLDLTVLKVGDVIGVLSSKPTDVSKIRAIKFFNGVKPFIDAAQVAAAMQGGGQRGSGGAGGGFSIPGLDGFGN
jgi:ribosomal protein L24